MLHVWVHPETGSEWLEHRDENSEYLHHEK